MQERKSEKALDGLIDMEIGLLLSDNQLIKGVLLDVKHDHLIVEVNQNVYYFARQHIQALSKNAKDFRVSSKIVPYFDENYLVDVLKALRYSWVSINSLSNQALFGVLIRISEDHIIVINNAEQLYIQKSSISNINRTISKNQIIKVTNQEQRDNQNSYTFNPELVSHMDDESKEQYDFTTEEVMQECQEQAILEHTQIISEVESKKNSETPVIEKHAEVSEIENVTSEHSEVQSEPEIKESSNIPQLAKHDLVSKDTDYESQTDISQEKTIQDSFFDINDESIGQSGTPLQDCKVEEQVAIEQTQTINDVGLIIKVESPIMVKQAEEVMGIGSVTHEHQEVRRQSRKISTYKLSRMVNHNTLKMVKECSPEVECKDVLESTKSVFVEEQIILAEPRVKRKKKRLLLTAWRTIDHDQNTIEGNNNYAKENDKDFGALEEKPESVEANIFHIPVIHLSQKEEKAMLEKQYYALMKYAEGNSSKMEHCSEHSKSLIQPTLDSKTNVFHIPEREMKSKVEIEILEKQYAALKKHAAKMYRQFRE